MMATAVIIITIIIQHGNWLYEDAEWFTSLTTAVGFQEARATTSQQNLSTSLLLNVLQITTLSHTHTHKGFYQVVRR